LRRTFDIYGALNTAKGKGALIGQNLSQILFQLIEKSEEHHIEYRGFLSNHMIHALVALHQLGGNLICTITFRLINNF